jgi:hypothetical protein
MREEPLPFTYSIDDPLEMAQDAAIEVTLDFGGGRRRWMAFMTPQALASCGDWVDGSQVRLHLGERHVHVVGELSRAIIDKVIRRLHADADLERHSAPINGDPKTDPNF